MSALNFLSVDYMLGNNTRINGRGSPLQSVWSQSLINLDINRTENYRKFTRTWKFNNTEINNNLNKKEGIYKFLELY